MISTILTMSLFRKRIALSMFLLFFLFSSSFGQKKIFYNTGDTYTSPYGVSSYYNWGNPGVAVFQQSSYISHPTAAELSDPTKNQDFMMPYNLMSPKVVGAGQKYPLFIMIHGAGEGLNNDNGCEYVFHPEIAACSSMYKSPLMWGGQIEYDSCYGGSGPSNGKYPSYALFVQTQGGWWGNNGNPHWQFDSTYMDKPTRAVFEIIDMLMSDTTNYKIDPERIYIGGLSNGGRGAFEMYLRRPDLFASLSCFSGMGNYSLAPRMVGSPIWMFQGGQDINPAPVESLKMYDSLVKYGGNPKYSLYQDRGHSVWIDAYQSKDWIKWVYSQNKKNITIGYGGSPNICEGLNTVKLAFAYGFSGYQWQKYNGTTFDDIAGATSYIYYADVAGQYRVRFRRKVNSTAVETWYNSNPIILNQITSESSKPTVTVGGSTALGNWTAGYNNQVILSIPSSPTNKFQWYKNTPASAVATSTSLNVDAANPGKYWVVVTEAGKCPSPASDTIFVTSGAASPVLPAPSNLSVVETTASQATLSWTDNSSNELGFQVEYSDASTGGAVYAGLAPANSNSFIVKNLSPGIIHYFVIRSINKEGYSAYSNTTNGTTLPDNTPPSAPVNLKTTNVSNSAVSLIWNSAIDDVRVISYDVYKSTGVLAGNTSDTTFSATGLTGNTAYTFYVIAKDYAGNQSLKSNLVSVTTSQIASGIDYKYYNGSWSRLPDFSLLTPVSPGPGRVNNFVLDGSANAANPTYVKTADTTNYFAFKFDGLIQISRAGTYTFFTSSDDGSNLYINNNPIEVVHNDYLQGTTERSGTVDLGVGLWPISVTYFEKTGGNVLQVRYQGPQGSGISKQLIPDNVLFRTVIPATSNASPTANAGTDKIVVTPATYPIMLPGKGSDPDGESITYSWTLLSGAPGLPTLSNTNKDTLLITSGFTTVGQYTFKLTVTDSHSPSASASDTVVVWLQNPNSPPTIVPIADQSITIPVDHITINAAVSDVDGNPITYAWTKISGPAFYTLSGTTTSSLTASNLVIGTYAFVLAASDNSNATSRDTVNVVVNSSGTFIQYLKLARADNNVADLVTLTNGYQIDLGSIGATTLSIRANIGAGTIDHIDWYTNGVLYRTNTTSDSPWFYIGGVALPNANYPNEFAFSPGSYTIKVIPFSSPTLQGDPYILTFTVVSGSVRWSGGGGDNDWSNAANWSGNSVPTAASNILLDNSLVSGSYTVNIASAASSLSSIEIGYPGNTNEINLIVTNPTLGDGNGVDLSIKAGGKLTLASDLTITGDILANGGKIDLANKKLNLNGNTSGTIDSLMTGVSGILEYGRSGDQTIFKATYNDLSISGSGIKTIAGPSTINGTINLTSGTLASGDVPGYLTIDFGKDGGIAHGGTGNLTGIVHTIRPVSQGWHYLSSALNGNSYKDFNDNLTLTTKDFFVYRESDPSNITNVGWETAYTPDLSTSLSGQKYPGGPLLLTGYALKFPSQTTLHMNGTYTHDAGSSYNTGPMSFTKSNNPAANGYHLIGNPYPSFIDFRSVLKNNLAGSITLYDPEFGQNITFFADDEDFSEISPYIGPMQAFWIQTTADGGTLTIPDSARKVRPNIGAYAKGKKFFRQASTALVRRTLKLSVASTTSGGCIDPTTIRFADIYEKGFDNQYDAYKFMNDVCQSLYTKLDGIEYATNSLPDSLIGIPISLCMKSYVSGKFIISSTITNFAATTSIYLHDKKTNTTVELHESPNYEFDYVVGDSANRFLITFVELVTSTDDSQSTGEIKLIQSGHDVSLNFDNIKGDKAAISITNTVGQQIRFIEEADISGGAYTIHLGKDQTGIYLVNIVTLDKVYTKKIFVSK